MKDNYFFDTNILIYLIADSSIKSEITKKNKAKEFLVTLGETSTASLISNQIVGEFINVLIKKYSFSQKIVQNHLSHILETFELRLLEYFDYKVALNITYKYKIGFYDALVVSKALNSNCSVLYSEDLSHNQIFENKLKVVNPFI